LSASSRASPARSTGHASCQPAGGEAIQGSSWLGSWRPAERRRTVDRNQLCRHSRNRRQPCSRGAELHSAVGMRLHCDCVQHCPCYHRRHLGQPSQGTPGHSFGLTRATTGELRLTAGSLGTPPPLRLRLTKDRRAINVINRGHPRYVTGTHGQPAGQVSALAVGGEPVLQAGSRSCKGRVWRSGWAGLPSIRLDSWAARRWTRGWLSE
jgi:hypothetical protein